MILFFQPPEPWHLSMNPHYSLLQGLAIAASIGLQFANSSSMNPWAGLAKLLFMSAFPLPAMLNIKNNAPKNFAFAIG
jgi:hypothetical protein